MSTNGRVGALLFALTVTVTAGCSDAVDGPSALPSPVSPPSSSNATPAPTSSSTAPSPDVSAETPEQAIRRVGIGYYQAVGRAYASLDTAELQQLTELNCEACQAQIKKIQGIKKDNWHVDGGAFTTSVDSVSLSTSFEGRVDVNLTYSGSRVLDRQGKLIYRMRAASANQRLTLVRIDKSWIVTGVYARP